MKTKKKEVEDLKDKWKEKGTKKRGKQKKQK